MLKKSTILTNLLSFFIWNTSKRPLQTAGVPTFSIVATSWVFNQLFLVTTTSCVSPWLFIFVLSYGFEGRVVSTAGDLQLVSDLCFSEADEKEMRPKPAAPHTQIPQLYHSTYLNNACSLTFYNVLQLSIAPYDSLQLCTTQWLLVTLEYYWLSMTSYKCMTFYNLIHPRWFSAHLTFFNFLCLSVTFYTSTNLQLIDFLRLFTFFGSKTSYTSTTYYDPL